MRIAIVGYGHVGRAVGRALCDKYRVEIYDTAQLGACGSDAQDRINACQLAFVAVGTPTAANGMCDLLAVEEVFTWLKVPACLKSTVAPGTTDRLLSRGIHVAFSPEYIGESVGHPWREITDVPFTLLGGHLRTANVVEDVFRSIFDDAHTYIYASPIALELCKYMENCFLATKVAFVNEFNTIAKDIGADFSEVRHLWLQDPRIGKSHTKVGDSGGFGGRCLPKDLKAILSMYDEQESLPLLQAVWKYALPPAASEDAECTRL